MGEAAHFLPPAVFSILKIKGGNLGMGKVAIVVWQIVVWQKLAWQKVANFGTFRRAATLSIFENQELEWTKWQIVVCLLPTPFQVDK